MKHSARQLNTLKLSLLRYSIFLQTLRKMLAEESSLWWMLALLSASKQDEPPASTAYARHAGRQFDLSKDKANERERTRSGGLASGVSSEKRDDANGERTNKFSHRSETLYFNTFWDWHKDSAIPLGQYSKNIYLGTTRLVTKLHNKLDELPAEQSRTDNCYYYHSDHLGSAQLITDYKGNEYQRLEYTPYGELWIEKTSSEANTKYLPYKFTGKERDEETGLYYFGARYLDAKYSRWLSADPALREYIPTVGGDNSKLPNGGVHNHVNLSLYNYSNNNPVKYSDPDGRFPLHGLIGAGIGAIVGVGVQLVKDLTSSNHQISSFSDYAGAFAGGAVTGAILAVTGDGKIAGRAGAATNAVVKNIGSAVESAIKGEDVDPVATAVSLAVDLAIDVPIGGIIGEKLSNTSLKGITSGKGSMLSVAKQMDTKVANGTIKSINNLRKQTFLKMAVGRNANGCILSGTVAGNAVADKGLSSPKQKLKDFITDKIKQMLD